MRTRVFFHSFHFSFFIFFIITRSTNCRRVTSNACAWEIKWRWALWFKRQKGASQVDKIELFCSTNIAPEKLTNQIICFNQFNICLLWKIKPWSTRSSFSSWSWNKKLWEKLMMTGKNIETGLKRSWIHSKISERIFFVKWSSVFNQHVQFPFSFTFLKNLTHPYLFSYSVSVYGTS